MIWSLILEESSQELTYIHIKSSINIATDTLNILLSYNVAIVMQQVCVSKINLYM